MNKKILITLTLGLSIVLWTTAYSYTSEMLSSANSLAAKEIIKNHSDDANAYNLDANVLRQEIALISRRV